MTNTYFTAGTDKLDDMIATNISISTPWPNASCAITPVTSGAVMTSYMPGMTERKVYSRMTNTYFTAGTDKLDDMIASIDHGYLLESVQSGMEDPKHWGIQCMVGLGREIKDGKLTGKVRQRQSETCALLFSHGSCRASDR